MNQDRKLTFEVWETLGQLESFSGAWDELLARSDCYRAFLFFEWYFHACRIGGLTPFVIGAMENRTLVGVLPLARTGEGNSEEQTLTYPLFHLADATDLIVGVDDIEVASRILEYFFASAHEGRAMFFRDIRGDSNIMKGAIALQRLGYEFDCEVDGRLAIPFLDVSKGWQHYFTETKSSNFRQKFKQGERFLAREGIRVEYVEATAADLAAVVDRFLELHVQSFRGESHLESASAQALARQVFPFAMARGFLRATLLRKQTGQILGVYLDTKGSAGRAMGVQHGYDPSLRKLGPGRMMCLKAVERACVEGVREYSLGRSSHDLKERLKTGDHKSYILTLRK